MNDFWLASYLERNEEKNKGVKIRRVRFLILEIFYCPKMLVILIYSSKWVQENI